MGWKGNFIEDEGRYYAAVDRKIKVNKRIGGRRKWYAAFEDAEELENWLFGQGEFEAKLEMDPNCSVDYDGIVDHRFEMGGKDYRCRCKRVNHPLDFYRGGNFMGSMREQIDEWGGLRENQHLAVRKIYAEAKEKVAGREVAVAAAKEADAACQFVGKVGDRVIFELAIERVMEFDGNFGQVFIHIMRDADQNIIVYKGGKKLGAKGEAIKVKASLKAHEERDGIKQNIIARPAIV